MAKYVVNKKLLWLNDKCLIERCYLDLNGMHTNNDPSVTATSSSSFHLHTHTLTPNHSLQTNTNTHTHTFLHFFHIFFSKYPIFYEAYSTNQHPILIERVNRWNKCYMSVPYIDPKNVWTLSDERQKFHCLNIVI